VPSLTVVVLTYNSESTIATCLNALVAQRYRDFKLIIVDDKSTDSTLSVVDSYRESLTLSVEINGSHNIATGRNIGLRKAETELVAFVDSDDSPTPEWTQVIVDAFEAEQNLALISGDLVPSHSTRVSQAIATNDDAIRQLFGKDVFLFCSSNCAINKRSTSLYFDENFRYAEDVEFASRVASTHPWKYVPSMRVNHTSRAGLRQYGLQMYRYGCWRIYYGARAHDFRLIDFAPLSLILASALLAAFYRKPIFLIAIVLFSLVESSFVILYRRPARNVAYLLFPAWLTKNVAWSFGVVRAMYTLVTNHEMRSILRSPVSAL